jgi:DNA-binding NarL/FixJ family response regulator
VRRTRILVADAIPIFRTGVRNLLIRESDFDVLEAANLDDIQRLGAEEHPDIALIDLELPPDGAVAAVAHLAEHSSSHLIVWSFTPTREDVFSALRGGASGYLHKEISSRGLVRALRGVVAGEAPLARDLAALMIDGLHGMERRANARERAAALSTRERQVLQLLATGARNKEIALDLVISEFTVKRHVQNILQKLELSSRHAAAGFYRAAFDGAGTAELISRSA